MRDAKNSCSHPFAAHHVHPIQSCTDLPSHILGEELGDSDLDMPSVNIPAAIESSTGQIGQSFTTRCMTKLADNLHARIRESPSTVGQCSIQYIEHLDRVSILRSSYI